MTFQPLLDQVVSEPHRNGHPIDCILLAGGGTESYVTGKLLVSQNRTPLLLHFEMDDGLKEAVWAQAQELQVPVLWVPKEAHMLHRRSEGYIPGYRMELILRAAQTAEIHNVTEVYIGDLEDDHPTGPLNGVFNREILGNDTRALAEFKHSTKLRMMELYNDVYRIGHEPLVLRAPYGGLSKAQVLGQGDKLQCDWNKTMTCRRNTRLMRSVETPGPSYDAPVRPNEPLHAQYAPCGGCYFCKSRAQAFAEAFLHDPVAARNIEKLGA